MPGIPGQIVSIADAARKLALVDVCGVRRQINIACIADGPLENCLGVWVLVHVGFAMSRIDAEEAQRTLKLLEELAEAQETLREMAGSA